MRHDEKEEIEPSQDKNTPFSGMLPVSSIVKIFKVTPQAVYYHITTGRLNVYKYGNKILIDPLEYAQMTKWDRKYKKKDGEYVYDKNKGTYSLSYLRDLLKVSYNSLYYLIKKGDLNFNKIDGCLIIDEMDLMSCEPIKHLVKNLLYQVADECANSDCQGFGQVNEEKVSSI